MTREERAAYMRAYRQRQPGKRPAVLDRSKPKGVNVKLNPSAYHRQYMRWWREQRKAEG